MDRNGNSANITRQDLDDLLVLAQTAYEIVQSASQRPAVSALRGMDDALRDSVFVALLNVTSSREFQRRRVAVRALSLRERQYEMRRIWGEMCRVLRDT